MSEATDRQARFMQAEGQTDSLKGMSTQDRQILSAFAADELQTVSVDDLIERFPCSRSVAHQILSRLNRNGWLHRVKRGLYAVIPLSTTSAGPVIEDPWALGMTLFEPAFVSGWSAAEHWDLTEQVFNSISIVTSKPQRESSVTYAGVSFVLRTLPQQRFFGARKIWSGSRSVMVADPSRLVVDVLDSPRFGGGGRHTLDVVKAYWRSEHRDPERVLDYALRFGRGTVLKRLGFIAELVEADVPSGWLNSCQEHLSKGISRLDPDVPGRGPIASRWRLRVNLPTEAS